MGSQSPLIPTPLTKILVLLNPVSSQAKPDCLCARIERRLVDCFEAYGRGKKGQDKCANLMYDYQECSHGIYQNQRYKAIQRERMKKYREGKIDKPFEEHPPLDGLMYYMD